MRKLLFLALGITATFATAAAADPLNVMYGVSRPPFIMENERTGISYELAAAAFDRMGVATNHSSDRTSVWRPC